jgi:hypothetical protein
MQVHDMNEKYINNAIYSESFQRDATDNCGSTVRDLVQNYHPQIKQGLTEIDDGSQVKPVQRERVYLHSIGRFSKLRKLQMRTYGD